MFVVGPDLWYELADGQGLRDAGISPAANEGNTLAEALPPDLAAASEANCRRALAGEPFLTEHTAGTRHFVTRGVPLRDADGRAAVLAVSYDITDRVRAEAEAAEGRVRFERIAATTPGLLYLFDLTEVRNVYVNDGVTRVLGYTPEQVAAFGPEFIPALIHPDDVSHTVEGNREFDRLGDGAVYEHEYRMRHAAGGWRLMRSRDTVFTRTPDGRAHTILGLAEGVTDRRAVADELRHSRSLLELVALLGSDWWFTARVEADGTAVTESLSPEFTRQLGYTPDELIAAGGWPTLVHPADAADAERQFARLLAGEEIEGELRHVAKDGRVLWHHYRTRPEADASGRVVRLVGASRDITARKEAEEGRRANDQLLRAVTAGLPNAAVFVVDADLRYTLAGGATMEAVGFTRPRSKARRWPKSSPQTFSPNTSRTTAGRSPADRSATNTCRTAGTTSPTAPPFGT